MYIGVQFKNRNKEFVGKVYDFKLHDDEEVPVEGQIARLMDEDYNYMFYGTRVKIVEVKPEVVAPEQCEIVRYLEASMEE